MCQVRSLYVSHHHVPNLYACIVSPQAHRASEPQPEPAAEEDWLSAAVCNVEDEMMPEVQEEDRLPSNSRVEQDEPISGTSEGNVDADCVLGEERLVRVYKLC